MPAPVCSRSRFTSAALYSISSSRYLVVGSISSGSDQPGVSPSGLLGQADSPAAGSASGSPGPGASVPVLSAGAVPSAGTVPAAGAASSAGSGGGSSAPSTPSAGGAGFSWPAPARAIRPSATASATTLVSRATLRIASSFPGIG